MHRRRDRRRPNLPARRCRASGSNVAATIAGFVVAIVALSVGLEAVIVFMIVIVVYQQIENYILQPAILLEELTAARRARVAAADAAETA